VNNYNGERRQICKATRNSIATEIFWTKHLKLSQKELGLRRAEKEKDRTMVQK
jgi:hypothetical protein